MPGTPLLGWGKEGGTEPLALISTGRKVCGCSAVKGMGEKRHKGGSG